MPSRLSLKNENLAYSGDIGHDLEFRNTSKQYQMSRFAKEKPISQQSARSLKFKDKAIAESLIRPPHADLPLEFVKNDNRGFVVHTNQHQQRKSTSREEELVRYMSKVPEFLQKGEKVQDTILNFGVLDWGRLEKWTHKQINLSATEGIIQPVTITCPTATSDTSVASGIANTEVAHQRERLTSSQIGSSHKVDCSPSVKPLSGRAIKYPHSQSSASCSFKDKEICRTGEPQSSDCLYLKSMKGKEKYLDHGSSFVTGIQSSKLGTHGHKSSDSSKRKISTPDAELEKCAEKFCDLGIDTHDQPYSGKHDSIFLLLPKDFSRPGSSEAPLRASLDGKSAEFNWGSFSDIFSVDEIHSDEPFSSIAHSCPMPYTAETETELDMKLDNLIKAQGIELPDNPPDMPLRSNEKIKKEETCSSTIFNASTGLDQRAPSFSAEMTRDSSVPHRFSFSLARMTRSLSFKEGSGHPQLWPTYATAKSGPAKPVGSDGFGTPKSNKVNLNGRTRNSPLRRLLDPLLKNKVANQMKEHPNDLRFNPMTENERCEAATTKALLQLTNKSGLPLFKFVVETKNEILASTVKSLSTFGKSDSRWLYTFYSVQQLRKKSGGWKNHRIKPCGFSYNIIGQMKVSNPHVPSWLGPKLKEQCMVKESVLHSVDLSTATSEFMTGTELAAIVVKVPNTGKNDTTFSNFFPNDGLPNFQENEKSSSTVVILPGGIHSLPNDGVPSPLIKRWRTGGSCDCGGWDVGCKLRILSNDVEDDKTLANSRSFPMQVRCDLFEQGEAKQKEPIFSLVPFRDGLFSVEFNAEISSLQAFSICVALINSHSSYATDELEVKQEFDRAKASMILQSEGPEKHAPHPPLSPVGRV